MIGGMRWLLHRGKGKREGQVGANSARDEGGNVVGPGHCTGFQGEQLWCASRGSVDCWASLGRRRLTWAQNELYPFLLIQKFSK
jgi:hypothetical protein